MDNKQPINTTLEFENNFNGFFADKHLSAAGRERVQQSMHLLSQYVGLNNSVIANDGGLAGIIVIMVEDAIRGSAHIGMAKIGGNDDKDRLFGDIESIVDQKSFDAVITVAEAWISTVEAGSKMECAPSQDPARKEAVVTTLHMNIDFKPCIVAVMQEISRNDGGPKLLAPQFSFSSGGDISGRMTGFETKLCPVT